MRKTKITELTIETHRRVEVSWYGSNPQHEPPHNQASADPETEIGDCRQLLPEAEPVKKKKKRSPR